MSEYVSAALIHEPKVEATARMKGVGVVLPVTLGMSTALDDVYTDVHEEVWDRVLNEMCGAAHGEVW